MSQVCPLVTIVTVTYNAQDHLEQTIQSIIDQDYPNIEYIIIDGLSSDNTLGIIKQYEQHIDHWVSEPDSGIYDAMNKAIDISTGKWINFMNAGDSFYHPSTISEVAKYFHDEYDLISGDIYYISDNDKQYYPAKGLNSVFDGMFCYHQTLFTRSHIMKDYKFSLDYIISSDYDFVLRCYNNDKKFKFLNFAIANFISEGMAETNNIRARIEDLFIISKYIDKIENIYQSGSFARLTSYKPDNNRLMAILMNNLHAECERLHLTEINFVLYGFGHIGQLIAEKYSDSITAIVDKNYIKLNEKHLRNIQNTDILIEKEFDYILISVLGREHEIRSFLQDQYHIPKNKILTFKI